MALTVFAFIIHVLYHCSPSQIRSAMFRSFSAHRRLRSERTHRIGEKGRGLSFLILIAFLIFGEFIFRLLTSTSMRCELPAAYLYSELPTTC
ncbi:hypothetical protein PO124_11130 [Bacillus licheniformis]|nr:hypothetical protein [Bacillus licheniformis]